MSRPRWEYFTPDELREAVLAVEIVDLGGFPGTGIAAYISPTALAQVDAASGGRTRAQVALVDGIAHAAISTLAGVRARVVSTFPPDADPLFLVALLALRAPGTWVIVGPGELNGAGARDR